MSEDTGPPGFPYDPDLLPQLQNRQARREAQERANELFFANMLVSAGSVMMALCGLCTGTMLAVLARPALSGDGLAAGLLLVAVPMGGILIAAGAGLYWWGRRLKRS